MIAMKLLRNISSMQPLNQTDEKWNGWNESIAASNAGSMRIRKWRQNARYFLCNKMLHKLFYTCFFSLFFLSLDLQPNGVPVEFFASRPIPFFPFSLITIEAVYSGLDWPNECERSGTKQLSHFIHRPNAFFKNYPPQSKNMHIYRLYFALTKITKFSHHTFVSQNGRDQACVFFYLLEITMQNHAIERMWKKIVFQYRMVSWWICFRQKGVVVDHKMHKRIEYERNRLSGIFIFSVSVFQSTVFFLNFVFVGSVPLFFVC